VTCHAIIENENFKMVTRNRDRISFALGLTSGIIAFISLLFTSIGDGIPSWYQGQNANNTAVIAQANLFYSCFVSNVTSGLISTSLTCTSYNSYICSTKSYQNVVLNQTAYLSGCTNPTSGSSSYLNFDAPIYQILLNDFYNLRSAAALSIISILFIFSSTIFSFIIAFIKLNIYFVFIGPILASIGVIFGVCCLVVAGSVFNYKGAGFALFVVGVLLELIVTMLLLIIAGRLNQMKNNIENPEEESIYARPISKPPIIIRRIHKQRI